MLAMVAPHMLSKEHSLAMVNDVFNGIFVTGNMLGDTMFYGHGAGKLPTASAVTADVIDCIRNRDRTAWCIWEETECRLADVAQTKKKFFVRVKASARKAAEEAFGGSSILEVPEHPEEAGVITRELTEQECSEKCALLKDSVISRIRML